MYTDSLPYKLQVEEVRIKVQEAKVALAQASVQFRRLQRWELMREIQVNGEMEQSDISLRFSDGKGTGSAPQQGFTVQVSNKYRL